MFFAVVLYSSQAILAVLLEKGMMEVSRRSESKGAAGRYWVQAAAQSGTSGRDQLERDHKRFAGTQR